MKYKRRKNIIVQNVIRKKSKNRTENDNTRKGHRTERIRKEVGEQKVREKRNIWREKKSERERT